MGGVQALQGAVHLLPSGGEVADIQWLMCPVLSCALAMHYQGLMSLGFMSFCLSPPMSMSLHIDGGMQTHRHTFK